MAAGPLTLGTAGHVDHGKTALVGALTGIDTDRLPEERERGLSIELGYAPLGLPSGRRLSVVDVPGHERFVRIMVAGATGIDLFLMVIAADDGVMPQTREHAAVLAALGVEVGVVAITKADLAAPELARGEAAALLPGAESVVVSVRSGLGLPELRAALDRAAARVPGERSIEEREPRLHVDRVFTVRGAGTVVTGTLWSGSVGRGDLLRIEPAGREARVRSVQVHDESVERAGPGQRVALNLAGLRVGEITRGDVVGAGVAPTFRVDCAMTWRSDDARPEHGTRVQVHHGTREAPARIAELGGRFAQLRLEAPIVAAPGDRLVVRAIAPPDTLGGGVVLDAGPPRHGPSNDLLARLERLRRGEPAEPNVQPLPPERQSPDVRAAVRPAPPSAVALAVEAELREAGLTPPSDADLDADAELAALRAAGRIARLGRGSHAHAEAIATAERAVVTLVERDGAVTIASLRDALDISRRYAQAYLEHCDAARLTLRVGDERVLRRRRSGG